MFRNVFTAAALIAIVYTSQAASADQIYSFVQITGNGPNTAPGSQFTVRVFGTGDAALISDYGGDIGANQALFVFENEVGVASSITDVYFQDGTLLSFGSPAVRQSAGVNFSTGATPANPPGGNDITPTFVTNPINFSADSNSPSVSANGVNSASEWLGILFNLQSGMGYSDVIDAIDRWSYDDSLPLADRWSKTGVPALRMAIHVQSIGGTNSNSYVSTPKDEEIQLNASPEPSSIILLTIGGVGLFGASRARRRKS